MTKTASITLAEDPRFDIVPVESVGGVLSAAQRTFRQRWLGPSAACDRVLSKLSRRSSAMKGNGSRVALCSSITARRNAR